MDRTRSLKDLRHLESEIDTQDFMPKTGPLMLKFTALKAYLTPAQTQFVDHIVDWLECGNPFVQYNVEDILTRAEKKMPGPLRGRITQQGYEARNKKDSTFAEFVNNRMFDGEENKFTRRLVRNRIRGVKTAKVDETARERYREEALTSLRNDITNYNRTMSEGEERWRHAGSRRKFILGGFLLMNEEEQNVADDAFAVALKRFFNVLRMSSLGTKQLLESGFLSSTGNDNIAGRKKILGEEDYSKFLVEAPAIHAHRLLPLLKPLVFVPKDRVSQGVAVVTTLSHFNKPENKVGWSTDYFSSVGYADLVHQCLEGYKKLDTQFYEQLSRDAISSRLQIGKLPVIPPRTLRWLRDSVPLQLDCLSLDMLDVLYPDENFVADTLITATPWSDNKEEFTKVAQLIEGRDDAEEPAGENDFILHFAVEYIFAAMVYFHKDEKNYSEDAFGEDAFGFMHLQSPNARRVLLHYRALAAAKQHAALQDSMLVQYLEEVVTEVYEPHDIEALRRVAPEQVAQKLMDAAKGNINMPGIRKILDVLPDPDAAAADVMEHVNRLLPDPGTVLPRYRLYEYHVPLGDITTGGVRIRPVLLDRMHSYVEPGPLGDLLAQKLKEE